MSNPVKTHYNFGQLDPETCLNQAQKIVEEFEPSQRGNNSGKLYENYWVYYFHKSSELTLIQNFKLLIEANIDNLKTQFNKEFSIEFICLTYCMDSSYPMCVGHRDDYFFDGQFHLTILGNGNIQILDEKNEKPMGIISQPNGTAWYCNGSEFYHTIKPTSGPRFELLAPNRIRTEYFGPMRSAVREDKMMWLDGTDPAWTEDRRRIRKGVLEDAASGRSYNTKLAKFSVED